MFEDCLTNTANLSSLELCIASWQIEITQSPALCPDYSDYSPFYTYSPMCVHGEISNEINAFNTKNSSVVERVGYNNNRTRNRGHVLLKGNSSVEQRRGEGAGRLVYTHATIRIQGTSTGPRSIVVE